MVAAMHIQNENARTAFGLRTTELRNIAIGFAVAIALIMVAGQITDSGSASGSVLDDTPEKRFAGISIQTVAGADYTITDTENTNGFTVTGATSGIADGVTVTVTLTDHASTPVAISDTCDVSSNAWSCNFQDGAGAGGNTATLADDSALSVSAAVAGASTSSTTANLDTTASTVTVGSIDISSDTGTSATDFNTNVAAQTLTATLSAALESSDVLYVSVDNGANYVDKTAGVSGTAVSTSITLSGSSNIKIKIQDDVGNDNTATTTAYILDQTAPTQTYASVDISADTGTSNSDFNTATAAQTLTATLSAAIAADDILQISVNDGSSWTNDDHATGDGTALSTSITLSGSSAIHIRITDDAGNSGTASETSYTLDTTAPTISFSSVDISADTGSSARADERRAGTERRSRRPPSP